MNNKFILLITIIITILILAITFAQTTPLPTGQSIVYYLKTINLNLISPEGIITQGALGETSVFLSAPILSTACIDKIIPSSSPASGTGKYFTTYSQQYNIDPAVALAFFRKESSFATNKNAIALKTNSIGNIRWVESIDKDRFEYYASPTNGKFRKYSSWEAGIEDWFKLIAGNVYVGEGRTTIETIVPKYAPSTENDTATYIKQVKQWTQEYRAMADNC